MTQPYPAGPASIASLACPTCGRPRCVPRGSSTPRCFVCEPQELWLDAQQAWNDTPPEERW
jgi:hypothetical protein